MKIILREEDHQYFVDDRPVRSWSEIARAAGLLEDLSGVPAHHLENAKARGAQVDDACSLYMENKFTSVHDELLADEARPYVDAYREFWNDAWLAKLPFHVQTPLYCAELDYCCTPDWHDAESVNDIKATSKPSRSWGLQTAAQLIAHGGERKGVRRRIIWLRPKLKTRQWEVLEGGSWSGDPGEDSRVFSIYDFDVVRAACRGEYDARCIQLWRMGG